MEALSTKNLNNLFEYVLFMVNCAGNPDWPKSIIWDFQVRAHLYQMISKCWMVPVTEAPDSKGLALESSLSKNNEDKLSLAEIGSEKLSFKIWARLKFVLLRKA